MIPDREILLEKIYYAIKKKDSGKIFGEPTSPKKAKSISNGHSGDETSHFLNRERARTIAELEKRVEALEFQNDHLLYFVNFIFENFSGLINDSCEPSHPGIRQSGPPVHHIEAIRNMLDAQQDENGNQPYPTRREMEVLDLLVKGYCAKEIANKLFISETTVVTHKKNLKEKFNARNTVELISKAYDSITPPKK